MNIYLIIAAWSGALTVAMDAYTTHVVTTLDAQSMKAVSTALQYQLTNSIVLMVLALFLTTWPSCKRRLLVVYGLFLLGTVIFCGTIYGAYLLGQSYLTNFAPLGGILMISGWLSLTLVAVIPTKQ